MNKLKQIKLKRKQVSILLGGKCIICLKNFGKNFNFHHVGYRLGEKKHSDFKTWIKYNEYVLPVIQNTPVHFTLLCNKCHRLISILQSIKSDSRFERLVNLARDSRK